MEKGLEATDTEKKFEPRCVDKGDYGDVVLSNGVWWAVGRVFFCFLFRHRSAKRIPQPSRLSNDSYFNTIRLTRQLLVRALLMQAVLGRTTAAKRQAARRIAKERNKRLSNEKRTAINENHQLARMRAGIAKEARIRRKQDWELGPLAPRRDVGQSAETYGTSDQRLMQLPSVLQKNRTSRWLIKEGDRVVIVKGRDQGQIGNVTSINKASESVVVEGLNLV